MATRTCPTCGTQYVATVRRCIDCDELLVDDAVDDSTGTTSTAAPVGEGDQVGYELAGWGNQLKVTLEGMLDRAGVPRAWEAGALLVPASQEATVDALIATVEGDDATVLDEAETKVALEIEGLDADERADLDARLLAEGVVHVWDDAGDLVVAEVDEDQVLAMIEEVFEGGAASEAEELAAQQALSSLFVAVDRLVKNPHDRKLATRFQEAASPLADLAVPYGFSNADWSSLKVEVQELSDRLAPHSAPGTSTDGDEDLADDATDETENADGAPEEADDDRDGDEADLSDLERDTIASRDLRTRLSDLV